MTSNKPIGEVIEAGTTAFVAQCLEVPREIVPRLYDPPPFGSFVKIGKPAPLQAQAPDVPPLGIEAGGADEEEDPFAAAFEPPAPSQTPSQISAGRGLAPAVYALVYAANTASLEPNRRPSALGFADEDEMRNQQPQIFELLRTEFSGLLIAYTDGGDKPLRRHLPPLPPRIHSRVYPCSPEETRLLTEDLSFLRALLLPSGGAAAGVPADELAAACLRGAREVHGDDEAFLLRAGRTLATLLPTDYERLQAILRNVI